MPQFSVGDVVYFRSYMGYGDWEAHAGQGGVIVEIQEGGLQHTAQHRYFVRWSDEVVSSVPQSNLFTVGQYLGHDPVVMRTAEDLGRRVGNTARVSDGMAEIVNRYVDRAFPITPPKKPVEIKQYRNFSEFLKAKDKTK